MTPTEAIETLKVFSRPFPKEAVETVIAHLDALRPTLLGILEHTLAHAEEVGNDPDAMGHTYAMFLLSQARETRAYPLIAELASLAPKVADALLGESITTDLSAFLASTCDGNLRLIKDLVENTEADEFARSAALVALVVLLKEGALGREDVTAYFLELLRTRLEREHSFIWNQVAISAVEMHPGFCLTELRDSYEQGLVDPSVIGLDEIESAAEADEENTMKALLSDNRVSFITDTVASMSWWYCFQEVAEVQPPKPVEKSSRPKPKEQPFKQSDWEYKPAEPIVREAPKVGRNDPCPCGSGKKYKTCCALG